MENYIVNGLLIGRYLKNRALNFDFKVLDLTIAY
jgi:hypothetical protein